MGKFDDLIYKMPAEYHNWAHYVSPRCGYPGTTVDPEAHVNFGFSVTDSENVMEVPHMHDASDEYLIFTGADLVDFFGSFDAEVEVWLGEDPRHMEKITITEPTIIRVPPKLWHCPINFKRVGKPVCFIPLYYDGGWCKITREETPEGRELYVVEGEGLRHCVYDMEKVCTYCGKCFSQQAQETPVSDEEFLAPYREMEKEPRTGKYDKYVYTIPPEYHQWGETFANPRAGFPGVTVMEKSKLYFGWDIMLKECPMDTAHIHHAVEEYLVFTGCDLMDPFASFDADIEILIGEDPDHMETYEITGPTVIRIPPNVWHCPINFKRIGKPVNFMPIYPDGCWSRITREYIKPDGSPTFVYEGVGLARCRLNPDKVCGYCGKCFSMMMDEMNENKES